MKLNFSTGRYLLVLLIGIFMAGSVLGLGISPARTTLDFKPGLVKDVSFEVVNSEGRDMSFVFLAQGDLAEYISSDVSRGSILASEKSKGFSYSLSLPNTLEPGLHTGEVIVMELPEEGSGGGSQVLATLAVATQVYVYVPHPGKYADAEMYIYSGNLGEPVRFVFSVVSAGEFDLTSVRANVDVSNGAGELIKSFNVGPISIASGDRGELVYDLKDELSVGNYIVRATLIYDEGTVPFEKIFSVGSEDLELQEVWVNDFSLGEIVKLEMLVENNWNEEIKDVLIETKIMNDVGAVVSKIKSSDYSVAPLSKQVFVSYWDTGGVLEGNYDVDVEIKYGNEVTKKDLTFEVSENELVVMGLGYVISSAGGGGSSSLVVVLVVVIVVLVLINLLWFFFLRKKLKK